MVQKGPFRVHVHGHQWEVDPFKSLFSHKIFLFSFDCYARINNCYGKERECGINPISSCHKTQRIKPRLISMTDKISCITVGSAEVLCGMATHSSLCHSAFLGTLQCFQVCKVLSKFPSTCGSHWLALGCHSEA